MDKYEIYYNGRLKKTTERAGMVGITLLGLCLDDAIVKKNDCIVPLYSCDISEIIRYVAAYDTNILDEGLFEI